MQSCTPKSKQSTIQATIEQSQLEMIKTVEESLKTMCSSMQQPQPRAGQEHKDKDDLFGAFVASQLKRMNQAQKAKVK